MICEKCGTDTYYIAGDKLLHTLNGKSECPKFKTMSDITKPQPKPTGEGAIVLHELIEPKINTLIQSYSLPQNRPLMRADALQLLLDDLKLRAETGKIKYGTYLRTGNGRDPAVDLYQEVCDGIMYAGQARLEGDLYAGQYLELLINIGHQLAELLHSRAGKQ
jgi:hypothetical protein